MYFFNYKQTPNNNLSGCHHSHGISLQGSHRAPIIKFPDFSMIFHKHIVKFPDHSDPRTALPQLMKSVTKPCWRQPKIPKAILSN